MARRKKQGKVEDLVNELVRNELQVQLSKLVRRSRRRVSTEAGKLNNMLRLEYRKDEGFIDAELIPESEPTEEVKKTENLPDGVEQE